MHKVIAMFSLGLFELLIVGGILLVVVLAILSLFFGKNK